MPAISEALYVNSVLPRPQVRIFAEPPAITLDRNGTIRHCNDAAANLFGFTPSALLAVPIAKLFPTLAGVVWVKDSHPSNRLNYLCEIGQSFEAVRCDNSPFAARLLLVDLPNEPGHNLRVVILPAGEQF